MMIEGILFDMDGVLFDTERPAVEMERQVAREMGFEIPAALCEQLPGTSTAETGALLRQALGPAFDYEVFLPRVRQGLERYHAQHGHVLMPAVRDTLELLRRQGYVMAVASASRDATVHGRLQGSGLAEYFSAAVGVDSAGGRGKPAPDIFLAAAAALGLPPARCAAVEDSYNGVRSAAAAGCLTVMVPDMLPPTEEMRALAATILPSLAQLPAFLLYAGGTPAPGRP